MNETKVMRLNEKEIALINLIRKGTPDELVRELRRGLYSDCDPYFLTMIKEMISIFDKPNLDLKYLINSQFMTQLQSETLIQALSENKNIMISGRCASGKTILLKALLENMIYSNTIVSGRTNEFNFDEKTCNNNSIKIINKENLSMNDIVSLGKHKGKLVLGEITEMEDGMNMLIALNSGCSVFGTVYADYSLTEYIFNLFPEHSKKYAEDSLKGKSVIWVDISMDNGYRQINKIDEILF